MEKLVSIIIPVYNAEKNISKCLESIMNQSYKNIEILCINDGSSDSSEIIINNYQKQDKRIVLINKENTGVSSTRNLGIEKAKGEYITFVDADDFLSDDYIEQMEKLAETKKAEIVISGFTKECNKKTELKSVYSQEILEITYPYAKEKYLMTNSFNSCWRQLIKRNLLNDKKIRFLQDIKYGEDSLFSYECYVESKNTYYINNFGYHYYINDESVMAKKDLKSIKKYYIDNKSTGEYILKKYKLNNVEKQKLYFKILIVFNNITTKLLRSENDITAKKSTIKEMRNTYNNIFKNYSILSCGTLKQKILLFSLKYKMYSIYLIFKKNKKENI